MNSTQPKDIFISGDIVSLCRPNIDEDIIYGIWHTWFNNQRTTRYLEHGIFPVSAIEESEIIRSEISKNTSLVLSIVENKTNNLVGVISLKDINHIYRRAEIALVTSEKHSAGAALEAMALMTTHAFDRLNLQKIYAGQHEELWKWVNVLSLIGYKVEGLRRQHGFRGGMSYDIILTGVTADDYYRLRSERKGDVLCGDAVKLALTRKRTNMVNEIRNILSAINKE